MATKRLQVDAMTDVDVQQKLLVGVAQQIRVCSVPSFPREEAL